MKFNRLKELRTDNALSLEQVATILNISEQTYNDYEMGINLIPTEMIIVLADFYNVSIDYIVERTDTKMPYPKNRD